MTKVNYGTEGAGKTTVASTIPVPRLDFGSPKSVVAYFDKRFEDGLKAEAIMAEKLKQESDDGI